MSNVRDLFEKKFGFGMMRLPLCGENTVDEEQVKKMVDYFLDNGFVYFDTAYVYHSQQSESIVKRCLVDRHNRNEFYLATKLPSFLVNSKEDMPTYFNTQIERCGVDYFDLYLIHALSKDSYEKMNGFGAFEFVSDLKKNGKVHFMGFSFHDKADVLDKILNEHPEVDFVQLQINYYDWENENVEAHKCYEVAKKHNKPIIVMEPVKGGSLTTLPKAAMDEINNNYEGSPASLAIRYAASLDQVMMVLSGMSDFSQMENNVSFMKEFKPLSDKEYKLIDKVVDITNSVDLISCTHCKYCVDGCPQEISIPTLFNIYNNDQKFNQGKANKVRYAGRTEDGKKASTCIKCGKCESICPQHINIRAELEKIAKMYE